MLKNFWYACEFSSAVTNKPKQIVMLNQRFVLYRDSQGQVVAMNDQCPHRGAALSLGWVKDDCIHCPYHGWKFQADGQCISIPANQPGAPIPKKARVDAYSVQEKYGFVWLFYGDLPEAERPPIPPLPEFEDSKLHYLFYECQVNAHYTRTLENALDFAHLSVVHANSFGKGFKREQTIEEYGVDVEEWSASARVDFKNYTKPNGFLKYFVRPSSSEVNSKISFYLPNINKLEVNFAAGKIVNFGIHIPVDDHTTLIKRIQFRSFFTYAWADPLFQRTNLKVSREDKVVAESQLPKAIPQHLSDEVHVSCDALSLAYRKLHQKHLAMGWGLNTHQNQSDKSERSTASLISLVN